MSDTKIRDLIHKVLKSDARIWYETSPPDKTLELNYTLLLKLIEDIDVRIIDTLIKEDKLKEKFFVKTKYAYVFKNNDFRFFMEKNKVDNSYTQYRNRIGLTDGKRFLEDTNDVVLDFPYKDCVLEGGQSTEEGMDTSFKYSEKTKQYEAEKTKRKEIFFNQIIASDEIDRLFDEKALVNWKRYTKKGEEKVKEIKRDKDGIIKENLIIKGNNLLALHSLKKQFTGKVKLIYIDPPYNTQNDGFKYNDKFKHSTWLTFMKNRLEAARELLRDDGVIFVQCDDNEQAYLKVLMDEVFKGDFVNCIIPEMSNLSGNKIEHAIQGRKFPKIKEYILLYAKNKKNCKLNIPKQSKNKWDSEYNIILPKIDEKVYFRIQDLIASNSKNELNTLLKNYKIESLKGYIKRNKIEDNLEWRIANSYRILASKPNTAIRKKALKFDFDTQLAVLRNSRGDLKVIRTDFNKNTETARIELVFAKNNLETFLGDIWFDITTTGGVAQEGGVVLKNGKKPEQLLEIIIKTATKENDIVLDYHLGSGTTCAVAHKMGRQCIGIEQLNYRGDDSIIRIQNVINGDKSGISKSVNWQGGGDFIYLELAKWNEQVKEQINACKKLEELEKLFITLYEKYFLNYNVKIKIFQEEVIQEDNFKKLSLKKQKKIFLEMLDLNQMYVQKTEMEDKKFGISVEEQKLTKEFYNDKR